MGPSLDDAITELPGAGPRTAARLAAHGLRTIADLLFLLPRAYDDLRRVTPIAALPSMPAGGVVLVRGVVKRVRVFPRRLLDVFVEEEGAIVRARWFRPPRGMEKSFAKGAVVTLAGPLRRLDAVADGKGNPTATADGNADASTSAATGPAGAVEIVQPSVYRDGPTGAAVSPSVPWQEDVGGLGVRARYPAVPGVSARVVEKIVAAAVDRYADLAIEVLDADLRARRELPPLADALRAIHARATSFSDESVAALATGRAPAHRRLAFEDLLILQVGFASGRRQARTQPARACTVDLDHTLGRIRAALPFALTGAQARAITEIAGDLAAPRPMQRLLVGDVGSGKTAVAFAAAALAAAAGGQTLLMAPTEPLVEQHLRTLGEMAAPLSLGVARLTASMPRAERAEVLARCRAGAVQLLVGTQALLEAGPIFPDLRLAIVDEQHRFGVAQRARLRGADATRLTGAGGGPGALPHLLVMSATPIPRTLALTLYGDLDVTLLNEMPPGRRATLTEIYVGDDQREAAYQRLRDAVGEGRQAFVVCPVRALATRAGAITAVARHRELRGQLAPAGIRVGLLHGDLEGTAKESVLRAFAAGAIDVLVATTVIELGIDVPNATVMLIEEADRFGLAQLHQLRGRVGRGAHAGACLLCTSAPISHASSDPASDSASPTSSTWHPIDQQTDATRRLRQLVATSDGFRIAEADLALRGHGDLFGARQAGAPRLRFADLADYLDLLESARAEAQRIETDDPNLALASHRALRAAVLARWSAGAVFAEETG